MTTNPPLIRLESLGKMYSTDEVETHALANINLEIHQGDYVAITGPSGCGKSTLLSILGFLDTPSSGRYLLAGNLVSELSFGERAVLRNQKLGFIFQNFNLIGELSVIDNVELPLAYAGVGRSERRKRAEASLARVGMEPRAHHLPRQLSGGQQQRVAVARALVTQPSLLLADEPTGNLDSVNSDQVMAMFQALNAEGVTICMVTHDPHFAAKAKRTIHMLDGQIAPPTASVFKKVMAR
jgi:putative ABC transport system ATP-binding protein